jgi:hypothetical protein
MPRVLVPGKNLNEVKSWDGVASNIAIGEYVFNVDGCIVGVSSGNHQQLEFDLSVVQGADTDLYNGITRKHWLVLTEKSAGRARCMLDACGVQLDAEGGFEADHFINAQFIAEVYEDTYSKPNLETGGTVDKVTNKIRNERHISLGFSNQEGVSAGPATATAAPVALPAALPVAQNQPAAPAAQALPMAGGPVPGRPATLPGQRAPNAIPPGARAPIPTRRR